MKPVCHIVAGPNGAGKSTFALDYLPEYVGSIEYVNPDLMAQGLSPRDASAGRRRKAKLDQRGNELDRRIELEKTKSRISSKEKKLKRLRNANR